MVDELTIEELRKHCACELRGGNAGRWRERKQARTVLVLMNRVTAANTALATERRRLVAATNLLLRAIMPLSAARSVLPDEIEDYLAKETTVIQEVA